MIFNFKAFASKKDSLSDGFSEKYFVALNQPASSLNKNFKPIPATEPDEKNPEAIMQTYEFKFGKITISIWNDTIHQVIYNINCETAEDSNLKNDLLNSFYAGKSKWEKLGKNDWGYWSERKDKIYFSSYSSYMDINSYGTVKFKESFVF